MRIIQIAFVFCLCFSSLTSNAQFHQSLYPNLEGDELLEAIKDYFTPSSVPSDNFARDLLYSEIYNVNGFVSCVYSGFTIQLPTGDPSQGAFSLGINAEHTMPRSLLEGTNREFDLHNLYPTRVNINSDRSTFPFTNITDSQTDSWYYLDTEQGNIPANNIDSYSEQVNGFFEPREDHKGNVARTMMYTYALYGDVIEDNSPQYFEQQRQTLCEWHIQDPTDQIEYDRTYLIASYQNDRPNPFVLDCTLAQRTFCQDLQVQCVLPAVSSNKNEDLPALDLIAQNPFSEQTTIQYSLSEEAHLRLVAYDAQGKLVKELVNKKQNFGSYAIDFQSNSQKGLYIIVSELTINGKTRVDFLKLIQE
jgi:hypothetical protein